MYQWNGDIENMGVCTVKTYIDKENATLIGYNRSKKPVYCEDNAKHIFVSGTTGSGKTVLLSNFIEHGIKKHYGMLMVDGKGDMGKGSMLDITKQFCEKHNRKLYVINMNEPTKSAKYNPLKNATETVAKDMLVNMTEWSEPHYKTNSERYIQRVVKYMNLAKIPLSFNSVIQNLPRDNFEMLSAHLQKQNIITKENHIENFDLIKASGEIAEQAAARFATIAESEIGGILSEDGTDIYTALNEGAVILFVLNPLLFPETSQAFGRLILIDAKKAVSKLFGNDRRTFFIFDEINVYASPVLVDLINKSRSAKVTCISATQSLADLEIVAGNAFLHQIVENCNNYVVLRQNSTMSAEEWAKVLGTQERFQLTHQISKTEATGVGTVKKVREFVTHPDEIKSFRVGEGVFLSKDTGVYEKIKVRKPF